MSLPSSRADFVPCDRLLQKAYWQRFWRFYFSVYFLAFVSIEKICQTLETVIMKDANAAMRDMTLLEKWPEKIQALNGIRTHDFCVTDAMLYQEPISRSLQLPHIPVTAFSQIQIPTGTSLSTDWCRHVQVRPHCFILTEACSYRLELAYFAGKISKYRLEKMDWPVKMQFLLGVWISRWNTVSGVWYIT